MRLYSAVKLKMSGVRARWSALLLAFVWAGLPGCTSDCDPDPAKMSRWCGATYQVGMNDTLEAHLDERRGEVDQLRKDALAMSQTLAASSEKLASAELKLSLVDAKTEPARLAVKRIVREIELKKMDLQSKTDELAALRVNLERLKQQKGAQTEQLAALEAAKIQIQQAKADIASLNTYLEEDLLIRAENALQYD